MTELELIALRDSLVGFDALLNALDARVVVLENAAVPKGTYFGQIIASFAGSPACGIIPSADPIDFLRLLLVQTPCTWVQSLVGILLHVTLLLVPHTHRLHLLMRLKVW